MFVLIPKDITATKMRGIALQETIYKLIAMVINLRIRSQVEFDDSLHGFISKRGTGTAIMELKLLMQKHSQSLDPLHIIFLDLTKAYDSVHRGRALQLLEKYGVGRRTLRIFRHYWKHNKLCPKQHGYFGRKIRARRGFPQGDILSPIIFAIVCDAVIRWWKRSLLEVAIEPQPLFFYADDGAITAQDQYYGQLAIDTMKDGFLAFGLEFNSEKTKFLTHSGGIPRLPNSTMGYRYRLLGEGKSHKERNLEKVSCPKCQTQVNRQYLSLHMRTKKCKENTMEGVVIRNEEVIPEFQNRPPAHYELSFPANQAACSCPVIECPYTASRRCDLYNHFANRHMDDTICILEDGILPQCVSCGRYGVKMLSEKHIASKECTDRSERLTKFRALKSRTNLNNVTFRINGVAIERVRSFKYLGRMVSERDCDHEAIECQLGRARTKWKRFSAILTAGGMDHRIAGYFYKVVVQTVLLYGSESWVISKTRLRMLESFHRRVARYLCRRHIRKLEDGTWEYPPSEEILEQAGLYTIQEYIQRRRDTITRYIRNRPIYTQCIRSHSLVGGTKRFWWNQKQFCETNN